MDIYTVLSVTQDLLQMFDNLVALDYVQTRSSQPLPFSKFLSMNFLAQN